MTMTKETLGREHRINVSPAPRYFCGMLKTEEEAIQAGIEYVEKLIKDK